MRPVHRRTARVNATSQQKLHGHSGQSANVQLCLKYEKNIYMTITNSQLDEKQSNNVRQKYSGSYRHLCRSVPAVLCDMLLALLRCVRLSLYTSPPLQNVYLKRIVKSMFWWILAGCIQPLQFS